MACAARPLNSLAKSEAAESRCSFSRCTSAAATRVDQRYCMAASAPQIASSVRKPNGLPIHLHSSRVAGGWRTAPRPSGASQAGTAQNSAQGYGTCCRSRHSWSLRPCWSPGAFAGGSGSIVEKVCPCPPAAAAAPPLPPVSFAHGRPHVIAAEPAPCVFKTCGALAGGYWTPAAPERDQDGACFFAWARRLHARRASKKSPRLSTTALLSTPSASAASRRVRLLGISRTAASV